MRANLFGQRQRELASHAATLLGSSTLRPFTLVACLASSALGLSPLQQYHQPGVVFSFGASHLELKELIMAPVRRRSSRLRGLHAMAPPSLSANYGASPKGTRLKRSKLQPKKKAAAAIKAKKAKASSKRNDKVKKVVPVDEFCLPRTREMELKAERENLSWVMGIDEAGRGPLAGPVVAAAAVVPQNIAGVIDSKKLTKEDKREELYEQLVASPNVQWAVAVVDSQRIDEINILQATMQGMRMAASALMDPPKKRLAAACTKQKGCYVVYGRTSDKGKAIKKKVKVKDMSTWFALVDGNRVPSDMPCEAEAMVKGDSREYAVAAASILAKVTRDRLMHTYDKQYPEYQLSKHKGYPTVAHMAAVKKYGASPIHRRTFAPLKHMMFDENGRVVEEDN